MVSQLKIAAKLEIKSEKKCHWLAGGEKASHFPLFLMIRRWTSIATAKLPNNWIHSFDFQTAYLAFKTIHFEILLCHFADETMLIFECCNFTYKKKYHWSDGRTTGNRIRLTNVAKQIVVIACATNTVIPVDNYLITDHYHTDKKKLFLGNYYSLQVLLHEKNAKIFPRHHCKISMQIKCLLPVRISVWAVRKMSWIDFTRKCHSLVVDTFQVIRLIAFWFLFSPHRHFSTCSTVFIQSSAIEQCFASQSARKNTHQTRNKSIISINPVRPVSACVGSLWLRGDWTV